MRTFESMFIDGWGDRCGMNKWLWICSAFRTMLRRATTAIALVTVDVPPIKGLTTSASLFGRLLLGYHISGVTCRGRARHGASMAEGEPS